MSRAIAGGRPAARPSPSRVLVLLAAVAALLVSGCSYQTAGVPKGDLTLTATFDDVQQLVAGHSVQMADITVGSVTKVELVGYKARVDRKSTRLNSSHVKISYAVFCLKKKKREAKK